MNRLGRARDGEAGSVDYAINYGTIWGKRQCDEDGRRAGLGGAEKRGGGGVVWAVTEPAAFRCTRAIPCRGERSGGDSKSFRPRKMIDVVCNVRGGIRWIAGQGHGASDRRDTARCPSMSVGSNRPRGWRLTRRHGAGGGGRGRSFSGTGPPDVGGDG